MSPLEAFLRQIFGAALEDEEEAEEEEVESLEGKVEVQEGMPLFKFCDSIEIALGIAKRLQLDSFSVIECKGKICLLTKDLDGKKAKFYQFKRSHYIETFLTEHGVSYYEHCSYRELETLSFLDTVAIE